MNSYSGLKIICLLIGYANIVKGDFYDLKATDITESSEVDFSSFRGKVLLVANVASQCGYTQSGYQDLQRLQDRYGKDDLFLVLAFPCNQFGSQEPGSNSDIAEFAATNFKADFPMFAKTDVVGPNAHPVWRHLVAESRTEPQWNFYKYLVDHKGKTVKVFPPNANSKHVEEAVKKAIAKAKKSKSGKTVKKELREDL